MERIVTFGKRVTLLNDFYDRWFTSSDKPVIQLEDAELTSIMWPLEVNGVKVTYEQVLSSLVNFIGYIKKRMDLKGEEISDPELRNKIESVVN